MLADAGYGLSAAFRQGLSWTRPHLGGRHPKASEGLSNDVELIFPISGHGRPRKHKIPNILSVAAEMMLAAERWKKLSWRRGTKVA